MRRRGRLSRPASPHAGAASPQTIRDKLTGPDADDADSKLLHRVVNELEFPSETFVVILGRRFSKTAKELKGMPSALIYERR